MKKPVSFFALFLAVLGTYAQCTIDTAAGRGITPTAANLPCVVVGAAYDQTIQVKCPNIADSSYSLLGINLPIPVQIDSMELDSVINLPTGITWSKNPNRLDGGQNGCLTFSGTTNAPAGYYELTWYGKAWVNVPQTGQETYAGNLYVNNTFNYYLHVISPGDSCTPTEGISEIDPALNTLMTISPNPSNGVFTLQMNAGSRVTGQVQVIDITGRVVFAEDVDLTGRQNMSIDLSNNAQGIYDILLKTTNGNAVKRIVID